jgi:hypothetical protein
MRPARVYSGLASATCGANLELRSSTGARGCARSKLLDCLRADHNHLLMEALLELGAIFTPEGPVEVLYHNLEDDNLITARLASVCPKAFRRRPGKCRESAEPACEFSPQLAIAFRSKGVAVVIEEWQENLDQEHQARTNKAPPRFRPCSAPPKSGLLAGVGDYVACKPAFRKAKLPAFAGVAVAPLARGRIALSFDLCNEAPPLPVPLGGASFYAGSGCSNRKRPWDSDYCSTAPYRPSAHDPARSLADRLSDRHALISLALWFFKLHLGSAAPAASPGSSSAFSPS